MRRVVGVGSSLDVNMRVRSSSLMVAKCHALAGDYGSHTLNRNG